MPLTLISATPSPFARMNRIALLEKNIPFTLQNEIPWHTGESQTPQYNPLEKLPILLNPDDPAFEPVYDSAHIQEYIVQKFADKAPALLTGDVDLDLKARQVLVLCEGLMDAAVLEFFESARPEGTRSEEWAARQGRKVDGGLKALEELVSKRRGEFLIGDGSVFTIADIAVVCTAGHVEFAGGRPGWRERYPELCAWWLKMEETGYFPSTRPVMFELRPDRVV